MQPLELSEDGRRLVGNLNSASQHQPPQSTDVIHISGVGGRLYFAYEQLRNAAEYSERHLLLRRAIERFLHRSLSLRSEKHDVARELIAELTQARYLKNDSIPRTTIHTIDTIVGRYFKLAAAVRNNHSVTRDQLTDWVFQTASVEIEHQLVDHVDTDAFIDYVYDHYHERIDREGFDVLDDSIYDLGVYCAVHRTLFKSDVATVRYYALAARIGGQGLGSIDYFVWLNQSIDEMYQAPLVNRLSRLINRYGAPMRILREVLLSTNDPAKVIADRGTLMSRVNSEAERQYHLTRKRLNEGIVRSIIFLLITKVLIGLAIEIPYDIITEGAIAWVPLVINLLVPPLYMATIGLGIRTPGKRNTEMIQSYLTRILYRTDDDPLEYRLRKRVVSRSLNTAFNIVYTITFLVSFGVMVYILKMLGYNLVSGAIFFVFISAVSFFGFRLLQTARELEMVDQQKGLFSVLLDFFYTPFIRVGNWLSDRYSRINIIGFVLDLAIELPLKTSLRVIQQWVGFLRDKQEDL